MSTIYLGLEDSLTRSRLYEELTSLGYQIRPVVEGGSFLEDDVWIVDAHHLDCLSSRILYPIFFAHDFSNEMIDWICSHYCCGLLDSHHSGLRLKASIDICLMIRMERVRLYSENQKLQRKLQDRRIIEKAKFVLMKRSRTSEEEAYQKMRRLAMQQQKTLRQIADYILLKEE